MAEDHEMSRAAAAGCLFAVAAFLVVVDVAICVVRLAGII